MSKNIIGSVAPIDRTDWARVTAMTDEDIVIDEDNPRTTERVQS